MEAALTLSCYCKQQRYPRKALIFINYNLFLWVLMNLSVSVSFVHMQIAAEVQIYSAVQF